MSVADKSKYISRKQKQPNIDPKDTALSVQYQSIASLVPFVRNARTHSKRQIDQIAHSIQEFGFTNPVLIDGSNGIIAGHGRILAAEQLGLKEVPTIELSYLSHAQKRAYIIADNKLAELAGWDEELLALEFEYLSEFDAEFDLTITGFEMGEIDVLIDDLHIEAVTEDEVQDVPDNYVAVTQRGDCWVLGAHSVVCGDATSSLDMAALMGEDKSQMVFCDPPYNVSIEKHVSGLGKHKHRDFAMAVGEMSQEEFTNFLSRFMAQLVSYSALGSIHYICMDWRHTLEMNLAGNQHYTELKNICVWNKDNGGMGAFYRSKHEFVFVFKHGDVPHINNFELGQYGRYRTNVWDYAGVNTMRKGRDEELAMHPTVKPIRMIEDAILDCSHRNDIVLDVFLGSGSTLIAAENKARRCYGMELDPIYVDTTIRRWQKHTGKKAVNVRTGQPFIDPLDSQNKNSHAVALIQDLRGDA